MRRKMAAGNWKMNGDSQTLAGLSDLPQGEDVDVVICPPLTLLAATAAAVTPLGFAAGGQTCHTATSGAHTGDVSAEMLKAAGAAYVIVGHSERRADHGETDADVADMARAAARAGLVPIICLGETLEERKAGQTLDVITRQLAGSVPADVAEVVIAYEPIWAIGTGEVATLDQIAEVHAHLRAELGARGEETRILYGGSVKPGNAAEIFGVANVDGALVGGASLSAQDFGPIVTAAASA